MVLDLLRTVRSGRGPERVRACQQLDLLLEAVTDLEKPTLEKLLKIHRAGGPPGIYARRFLVKCFPEVQPLLLVEERDREGNVEYFDEPPASNLRELLKSVVAVSLGLVLGAGIVYLFDPTLGGLFGPQRDPIERSL